MQFNSDMLATLRGRLGYADDNLLFYLTAGFAWLDAEIDNSANLGGDDTPDPNDPGGKRNIDALGGVAGLGMEWGITQNLSAKVEGQYIFFNDVHHIDALGSEGDPGDFFQIDDGFAFQLGVNYRFNPFYDVPDYTRRSTNGLTAAGPGVFAEPRAMQAANAEIGPDKEAGKRVELIEVKNGG